MKGFSELAQIAGGLSFILGGFASQKALIVLERIQYASDAFGRLHLFGGPLIPSMAVILVFSLLTMKFSTRKLVFAALILGAASQVAGCALLLASSFLPDATHQLSLVYNVLNPISSSSAVLPWVYLLARVNPLSAALGNAVCIIISGVIVYGLESNDLPKFAFMMLVLIAFSLFCFFNADKDIPLKEGTNRWVFPYKAVAFVAAYSFAYGISTTTFVIESMRYAAMLPALFVVILIAFNSKHFTLFALCRIAFPLAIGGFFLVSFIPGLPPSILGAVLHSGDACLSMLVLLMACTVSYSTKSSPIWVFGVFYLFQFAAQLAGAGVGLATKWLGGSWYLAAIMIAAVIVVATTFILSSEKNLFSFWEHRIIEGKNEGASLEELTELKVRCLGVTYGFTDREMEIVKLAALGQTNAQIARETFISEGTVKVHLHHVYQKLGVHTRKELLQMIQDQKKEVKPPTLQ